jgi:hypothetical protein
MERDRCAGCQRHQNNYGCKDSFQLFLPSGAQDFV